MKIGIDMGGMSVKIGLVNEENHIVATKVIKTNLEVSPEVFIEEIAQGVQALLEEQQIERKECKCIGIGSPGTIDEKEGVIIYSNNFNWENVPIIAELRKHIALPMKIANDADAAALGETLAGAAKGCSNAVLITLGTGVGGGVIIDKQIFAGPLIGGSEFGHTVIVYNGISCTCGRKGCLETYASASALLRITKEKVFETSEGKLSSVYQMCNGKQEEVNGKMPFDAAQSGDLIGKEIVEEYLEYLACGIANAINIFRPEKVILGGGVSAQGENISKPLQEKVNQLCFAKDRSQIAEIVTSKLGNDAGIIGAANLFGRILE